MASLFFFPVEKLSFHLLTASLRGLMHKCANSLKLGQGPKRAPGSHIAFLPPSLFYLPLSHTLSRASRSHKHTSPPAPPAPLSPLSNAVMANVLVLQNHTLFHIFLWRSYLMFFSMLQGMSMLLPSAWGLSGKEGLFGSGPGGELRAE